MAKEYDVYPRKRINYEDDVVIVFDEDGETIYNGLEDYEPMKDEEWVYDEKEQVYRLDDYVKICITV